MIIIGILAPDNSSEIEKALKNIIHSKGYISAVNENSIQTKKKLALYERSGIDYSIIIFNAKKIYPVNLDILILDNAKNQKIVTLDLIKCITERTMLIYNTDNGYLPALSHPNAIDYGFDPNSAVTISSVGYNDTSTDILLYISRPLFGIFSNNIYIGELLINSEQHTDIPNLIPAIICGLVCDIIYEHTVKI